jgi:hypothetical protein
VDSQREMPDQRESFGQDCPGERGEDVGTGEGERVVCVKKLDSFTIAGTLLVIARWEGIHSGHYVQTPVQLQYLGQAILRRVSAFFEISHRPCDLPCSWMIGDMDTTSGTQHVKPDPGVEHDESAQYRGHCIEPRQEYSLLAKFIWQVEESAWFGSWRLNCNLGTDIVMNRKIAKTSSLRASHREYQAARRSSVGISPRRGTETPYLDGNGFEE